MTSSINLSEYDVRFIDQGNVPEGRYFSVEKQVRGGDQPLWSPVATFWGGEGWRVKSVKAMPGLRENRAWEAAHPLTYDDNPKRGDCIPAMLCGLMFGCLCTFFVMRFVG